MSVAENQTTIARAVRARRGERFGYGLTTADRYLKQVADAMGYRQAEKLFGDQLGPMIAKSKRQLVYAAEGMTTDPGMVKRATSRSSFSDLLPQGIEAPPKTLMVFHHTITTPREDRDTDVLHTLGADLDPRSPLLWQHVPMLPIGKHLAKTEHTAAALKGWTALLDMNELTSDAATLIEADVLRFSHGFRVMEYSERQRAPGQVDAPTGFDITKYEIMEISLVSVPSNVEAEIELWSRGQLESDICKAHAKHANSRRRKQFRGVGPGEKIAQRLDDFASRVIPQISMAGESFEDDQAEQAERWNPSWPKSFDKAFDVERQHLEPSNLEYDWVSRYLSCEVKQIYQLCELAAGARTAPYLAYLEDELAKTEMRDRRNITGSGREIPPETHAMQLSSKESRDLLIDGLTFHKDHAQSGWHFVVKREATWVGVRIVIYAAEKDREKAIALNSKVWKRCREENPLKGEAFSLSGEFLERGTTDWDQVFLTERNEKAMRKAQAALEKPNMPARGIMAMGKPGTGKTLTGRVLLDQTKATYVWVTAKDLARTGGFFGLQMAFEVARECAPSILLLEDIDAWLQSHTIDLLKAEMDGLKQHRGTLTILTTNHPEQLPDALLDRPGRFHDVLEFGLPDKSIRLRMLTAWAPGASEQALAELAEQTDGCSGAHLYELCQFAKSIREAEPATTADDALAQALETTAEQRQIVRRLRGTGRRAAQAATKGASGEQAASNATDQTAAKPAELPTQEKAGRKISAKNMRMLAEIYSDLEALADMDLPRSAQALIQRCLKALDEMMEYDEPEEDEESSATGTETKQTTSHVAFWLQASTDTLHQQRAILEGVIAAKAAQHAAQQADSDLAQLLDKPNHP